MPRRRPLPFLLLAACCAGGAFAQPAPSAAPPAAATAPGAPASAAAKATPAAAAAQGVPTVNPGFESTKTGSRGDPEGWFTFQHAGNPSYRYIVDADNPHGGTRSLRIENIGPEPYGAIAQSFDAKPHVGKVAKLSGWLRTKDANSDGGAGLTLLPLLILSEVTYRLVELPSIRLGQRINAGKRQPMSDVASRATE